MQKARKKTAVQGRIIKILLYCLAAVLLILVAIAVKLQLANNAMRSSQLYKLSLIKVTTHPEVIKAVGLPVKDGGFIKGGIKVSGSSTEATLVYPIYGPEGRAIVNVQAEKKDAKWIYSTLQVTIRETSKKINLLE